jgi:hypothetical protein
VLVHKNGEAVLGLHSLGLGIDPANHAKLNQLA